MAYSRLVVGVALFTIISLAEANSPPNPQTWGPLPPFSAQVGDSVNWDISSSFSDPDGDDLTFYVLGWSKPLPAGLSLDEDTGVISGTITALTSVGTTVYIRALDTSGANSTFQFLHIYRVISHGAFTDLFFRECDPSEFMCIPGYDYNRGDLNSGRATLVEPDLSQSSSQYPDPPEATRMAASVGYEGAELTPAISMYMSPGNEERTTGNQFGIARHTLSDDVTIIAQLTYSQSGGVLAPVMDPSTEELPFGAVTAAQLLVFQLDPAANGWIDPLLCDWISAGFESDPWGPVPRGLRDCITRDIHPDIINLQVADFSLPEVGDFRTPGNGTPTAAVPNGLTTAELFVERNPALPTDPEIFIMVSIESMARYGGVVDSQNTLRVSFDNPEAVEPAMPEITEPSFEPAPQAGGDVEINESECININGHGRIPLVIEGDEYMPAGLIDVDSIEFGDLELASRGSRNNPKPACSIDDVNLDNFDDLICQFIDDPTAWTGGSGGIMTVAWSLVGGGESYSATDLVCLTD